MATIAKSTVGFTGADLENLVNEASLLAARQNKRAITMQEIQEATIKVIAGPEKKSHKVAEKEKRLVQHNFKTTESEARIIRKKMEALGITNESAYMRALALNGYILKLDLPQIREMIRLLSNMTNNLNQIARRLNEQGQMYDTEMEEMLQKQDELWQMMRKLLSILERTGL